MWLQLHQQRHLSGALRRGQGTAARRSIRCSDSRCSRDQGQQGRRVDTQRIGRRSMEAVRWRPSVPSRLTVNPFGATRCRRRFRAAGGCTMLAPSAKPAVCPQCLARRELPIVHHVEQQNSDVKLSRRRRDPRACRRFLARPATCVVQPRVWANRYVLVEFLPLLGNPLLVSNESEEELDSSMKEQSSDNGVCVGEEVDVGGVLQVSQEMLVRLMEGLAQAQRGNPDLSFVRPRLPVAFDVTGQQLRADALRALVESEQRVKLIRSRLVALQNPGNRVAHRLLRVDRVLARSNERQSPSSPIPSSGRLDLGVLTSETRSAEPMCGPKDDSSAIKSTQSTQEACQL